jgi:formate/nitrite transporter FocA (FNT family)
VTQADQETHKETDPSVTSAVDHPREDRIEQSIDRTVDEGLPRLRRRWPDMLITGSVGGIEVGFGVLALLFIKHETGSDALAGLAFSIGFIALRLGHSELFTEGFLVPVTVVATGEARLRDLLKLWGLTLAGNLLGGWVIMNIVTSALPELRRTAAISGDFYINSGIGVHSLSRAILAGAAMTLMTRMQNGTDSEVARLAVCVAVGFLIAGARLFHSVLDSLLAFGSLSTGHAAFGYSDWAAWFGWAILGNLIGGLVLTTFLRMLRSRGRIAEHRASNDLGPAPGSGLING